MKLFISCAEPSGDIIAAEVLETLKHQFKDRELTIEGIGGMACQQQGLTPLFPMTELTVHGFAEVLPKAISILRRIRQTADYILQFNPSLVITIDAFDFHIRVVKRLRKKGFKGRIVHLVAPAVWAWGEGRARKIMRFYDALYCLLPFEPAYFQKAGFISKFVGNPVVDRFSHVPKASSFRQKHRIADEAFIFTVLPGSRESEVTRLLPTFLECMELASTHLPNLHVIIPTFPEFWDQIKEKTQEYPFPITLIEQEEKTECFLNTDFALAASGTVALELSLFHFPFVIAYKVSPLTAWIGRKIAKVQYICLINLLMDKPIVPEFIQEDCIPKKIYSGIWHLLHHKKAQDLFHQEKAKALSLLKITNKKMPECFISTLLKDFPELDVFPFPPHDKISEK